MSTDRLQPFVSGLAGQADLAGGPAPLVAAEGWVDPKGDGVLEVILVKWSSNAQRDANYSPDDALQFCEGIQNSSGAKSDPSPVGAGSSEATCSAAQGGRSIPVRGVSMARGDYTALVAGYGSATGVVDGTAIKEQDRLPAGAPPAPKKRSASYVAGKITGVVVLVGVITGIVVWGVRRDRKRGQATAYAWPGQPPIVNQHGTGGSTPPLRADDSA